MQIIFYLHLIFYKQSVYKQLTLEWQIAGFNFQGSTKQQQKLQIKKSGVFFFAINVKKVVKPTTQKDSVSQKNFKISDHKY